MKWRRSGAQACGAALVVGVAWCASPSPADGDAALVGQYYGAIEAAEQCESRRFDQPAHERMAAVINDRGGSDIPFVERMALISNSRSEAKDVIFKFGCKSDQVEELLQLFHSDLEPAL